MIFASILALKNPSKSGFPSTFFRRFPQDMSKMHPRDYQDAPRRLQDTSKTPLRPSKKPPRCRQDTPRKPKDTSKLLQIALKHPKSATKLKDLINL